MLRIVNVVEMTKPARLDSGEESFFNAVYAAIGISGTCCLFLSELVVQAYTWRSTWQVIRITKRIGSRKPLLFFLLRDGKHAQSPSIITLLSCSQVPLHGCQCAISCKNERLTSNFCQDPHYVGGHIGEPRGASFTDP